MSVILELEDCVLDVAVTVMLAGQPTLAPLPVTANGVKRCVVVPSPICPFPLLPQHLAAPEVVIAQA